MVNTSPAQENQPPIDARPPHVDAARAWARTVFGAPRAFDELVVDHRQADVNVMRIVTEVARRAMVTKRAPMPPGYTPRGQAIAPTQIDPFTLDAASLQAGTEHAERCGGCNGAGGACARCGGSGAELVSLTFTEERRVDMKITPSDRVALAYPRLAVPAPLAEGEMSDFRPLGHAVAEGGPIQRGQLPMDEEEILKAHRPRIDPHSERVLRQEYARWAVISRTMTYEMCGASGEIAQWGARFEPGVAGPVRRRLLLWGGFGLASFVVATGLWLALSVRVPYMAQANFALAGTLVVAAIGAAGAVGGVLRAWRPSRLGKLRLLDFAFAGVLVIGIGGSGAVKVLTKPKVEAAREAIQQGNYPLAEKIMAALVATGASDADISALHDDIEWAEARKTEGDARLARMEAIAQKNNAHSPDAIAEVREIHMGKVKRLLVAKDSAGAHKMIDQLFPGSQDPDVVELRARAFDVEVEACGDDACRYVAGQKAARTAVTPARSSRIADLRSKLMGALYFEEGSMETTLMKLRRLRAAEEKAKEISPLVKDDPELLARIAAITRKTGELRESAHVIGVSPDLIAEIYGGTKPGPEGAVIVEQSDVHAYFPVDKAGVTTGIYLVGATPEVRKGGLGAQYKLGSFLSKAAGRPVQLPPAPKGEFADVPVVWKEGAAHIEARYLDGKLMEVRVDGGTPSAPGPKPPTPKPLPPKTAAVAAHVAAFPGGTIAIDGVVVGRDAVTLKLTPGAHEIVVKNQFLGEHKETATVSEQSPNVTVVW